jgi:AmmeMemoRadiSam system protein B
MSGEMRPKLRHVQVSRGQQHGQQVLVLSDPWGLSDCAVILPASLAPVLEMCDGTRDVATLRTVLELRIGLRVGPDYLEKMFIALDKALMIDNEHFAQVYEEAVKKFRTAPSRPPTMADRVYPANSELLEQVLCGYFDGLLPDAEDMTKAAEVRGLVSPHIDYQRGGVVYAEVWRRAARAARAAEVAIILGTNHFNGRELITLTKQSYSTPWGVLATAGDVVDAVASALGEGEVFAEEFNHRNEHSVEAAAVWLHCLVKEKGCELVPVLCGSFQRFIEGDGNPGDDDGIARFVEAVRNATANRRTLIVAAGDLAHLGPAFGDRYPIDVLEKARLSAADSELMSAIASGDAEGMFRQVKKEGDRRRICGLSSIYLALRLLGKARGEVTGYAQCPADEQGASVVSICGIVLT